MERLSDLMGPFQKVSPRQNFEMPYPPRSFSSRPAVVPIVNISEPQCVAQR